MSTLEAIVADWQQQLAAGASALVAALAVDLAGSDAERVEQLRRAADFFDRFELTPASRAEIRMAVAQLVRTGSTPELERRNAAAAALERTLAADLERDSAVARADAVIMDVQRLERAVAQLTTERDRLAACLAAVASAAAGEGIDG